MFVRSQASQGIAGGLAPSTYPVMRALRRLFDLVLLETVGVGQSEDDVRHVADATYLLLQPMAGDTLQHLKAGLMEAPDALVVTKCDAGEAARRAVAELEGSARARPPGRAPAGARRQRPHRRRHRRPGRGRRRDRRRPARSATATTGT